MTSKNESHRRKLYLTLYRLGIANLLDTTLHQNIYIDDSGYVLVINPDGVVDMMGQLSFSGEFICKNQDSQKG